MNQELQKRLNQIPDKILSEEFLTSQGLGNEIGFWIFDYAPEDELQVREHLAALENAFAKKNSEVKLLNINLLETLKAYLDSRGLTEASINIQTEKGDASLLKALTGPLHMDKFAPFFMQHHKPEEQDIIFITGVGSVWPLMRAHSLLNKLHALLGHKPLVLFYPGFYSGQDMTLFNRIVSNNYYRAFELVPQ